MRIVVVYGAPMSGKTSYVNDAMKDIDLVFDYDALTQALTNSKYQHHNDSAHKPVMEIRNNMIEHAKQMKEGTLYIITTYLSYTLLDKVETHFNTQYKQMVTSLDECKHRLNASDRYNKHHLMQVIHEWYGKYVYNKGLVDNDELTSETKKLYKSKEWQTLRYMALERDNHLCQMCLRKSRYIDADLVHHMIYVKSDFEKALDIDNLMCVCSNCHNRIHGKDEEEVFSKENIERKVRTIKL